MPLNAEEIEGLAGVVVEAMKKALEPLKLRIAALEKEQRQVKVTEALRNELQKAVD